MSTQTAAADVLAGECSPDLVALEGCHVAVLRALEVAGKRLLTRDLRGRYHHVAAHELHLHVEARAGELDRLLDGAWSCLIAARDDHARLVPVLDRYVRLLLLVGQPHCRADLRRAMIQAGLCG